jgi:malate dehydrogenase (oxaloacetate-decarboxylating)
VGLSTINNAMIEAGLAALAAVIPASGDPDLPLMPAIADVQAVSAVVAEAVALEGVRQGLARLATTPEQARQQLARARWQPRYGPVAPGA